MQVRKIPVIVEVPERPPFRCFWSAQVRWPIGATKLEVTPEQLRQLQADAAEGFLSVRRQDCSS